MTENLQETSENSPTVSQDEKSSNSEKILDYQGNNDSELSKNVINRFFGLFENILGSKDYFRAEDVRTLQNNVSQDSEVKEVVKNELEVADNADVSGDVIPSSEPVAVSPEPATAKVDRVVPSFPSPTPSASDSSEISPLDIFKQLSLESPRKASRYFEENAKEILRDVSFV